MEENKSILHELYVFSEWKPEPEYIQKPDSILPENISALWRWFNFLGPKKNLLDGVTSHLEKQEKWHIALGDEGKVIAVLTDNILEIRTRRSEYATIAARTTVSRDAYPQWRKLAWSPDCSLVVLAYGNGVVSFFDLTASNLFNIPTDCSRPGGLECTDNTHAVADIIFMPLRVKDTKWNWEVLVVTYDGKLRGYLVSQTDGCKLHHSFRFPGGVAALRYCESHSTMYVAGVPRGSAKEPMSSLNAGITAWRILNEEPYYKLSVVSDELEAHATERFKLYVPFGHSNNQAFIVQMELSPDGTKLVCAHCNGAVSVWRLPLLRLQRHWPLAAQPTHGLSNPLAGDHKPGNKKDLAAFYPADINWWTNEEIIVSRFSGAVTICDIQTMVNILGKKPEFFQGVPQITAAHGGGVMVLECESSALPAQRSRSDDTMEVVKADSDSEDTMLELAKELVKSVLYAITDIETFQPKPRRITVVSRVYRLLGLKSTTPTELFSRKIESGQYGAALALARRFGLDCDLVYQQQWRRHPVSSDAIHSYLSKVSKKIWAVHQCVDRLPETLPAAKELLQFGLELTNKTIIEEINKDLAEGLQDPEHITPQHLNAYTSELLRCRHVMLFYRERLSLYESILKCEKSTYVKDEYDRLRSNSIVHSAMEIAKEGRVRALTCLWAHVGGAALQLAVLGRLPETLHPAAYRQLLPAARPAPAAPAPPAPAPDWCRKDVFRSIWSSNWSEDASPENETGGGVGAGADEVARWYSRRAREIEERSGLVSHALALVQLAAAAAVEGLDALAFQLATLDVLLYDVNVEGVTLQQLQNMSTLDVCALLMKMSTPQTFVADLQRLVVPYLQRCERLPHCADSCTAALVAYLETISVDDLSPILLVLQSPQALQLDVRTHLELVERCLYAHAGTDQLDKACDLLHTLLKESDGSVGGAALVRRVREVERLLAAGERLACRGLAVPPRELVRLRGEPAAAAQLLTKLARSLALREEKPTPQDWDKLLKDLLDLQSTLFGRVTKDKCYEIYALALLTSGDAASIRLAADVLTCGPGAGGAAGGAGGAAGGAGARLPYNKSVSLVSAAATEYFNSANSLVDPGLELAKCCLQLIDADNAEIQKELDLINALPILHSFNVGVLPVQVRICEDRMSLIEACLALDPGAYLASHKLLKLAALLRIAGDDERAREGLVLQLAAEHALAAGAAGGGGAGGAAGVELARRLAALRHAPAAPLLAGVARAARTHADTATRRQLLAAALTHLAPPHMEAALRHRMALELESLQQMGVTVKEHGSLGERWPSTDDEFADAVTTPMVEKKDLVPAQSEVKIPLFNYLLDTFQNKFAIGDNRRAPAAEAEAERAPHCQEFYGSLYPELAVSASYYRYDRFSLPDATDAPVAVGQNVLKWFYIQNCLEEGVTCELETEVVQRCAEELVYKDTALGVACLLRAAGGAGGGAGAAAAALYAELVHCNCNILRDNAYFTKPAEMCRDTLALGGGGGGGGGVAEEQLAVLRLCVARLAAVAELDAVRALGYPVNGPLFNADDEYRREVIYRLARSPDGSGAAVSLAQRLARAHGVCALDVWLQHAGAALQAAPPAPPAPPPAALAPAAHARIKEALWPLIPGTEHNALIMLFSLLKGVDEKALVGPLTAAEHIKLLKKAKAASPELDYKLVVEGDAETLAAHVLAILRPDNVALLTKLLRTLPAALRPPPLHAIYAKWLTNYFFAVPSSTATSKKWMQQYRQCASYFNKLAKHELVQFVADTCFSDEAIQRVPAGTRNLMIMQAVDYCQQEQENDFKFNKNEQSWACVGQELSRWARFLDNFHSATLQQLAQAAGLTALDIWPEVEKSHGDPSRLIPCLARGVAQTEVRAGTLARLLQCLHVPAQPAQLLQHLALHCRSASDVELLVARITAYSKEGVDFPEELLETAMQKASEFALSPHKQIGLLSLSQKTRVHDSDDLLKIAQFTVELFRTEWPDSDYARELTDEVLLSEEGRREAFSKFLSLADSWQRKKALVDVLHCWPPTRNSDSRSLHCEYVHRLLSDKSDQTENLTLIKLLLQRPVLTEEEVKWLADNVVPESVINAIWVLLLSKSEHFKDNILNLALQHKIFFQNHEVDDDLIKELLDNGMFIKLVSCPLYSCLINYIMSTEGSEPARSVQWAVGELAGAGLAAEAGQLRLAAAGVPAPLRGFSQAVGCGVAESARAFAYFKHMLHD